MISFFTPKDLGPKVWGTETLVSEIPNLCIGKVLKMKAGTKGALQYHKHKNEAHYLIEGQIMLTWGIGNESFGHQLVSAGESWHIPPGTIHQEEAITDCTIFEISNPVFDDRVKV